MDPGTPTRPPEYFIGYTDNHSTNHHDSRDSMNGPTTSTSSHYNSSFVNPAAVRLLDSGGMYDDDALTPPSLRTTDHSRVSALPPQLPEIRPLASATSYVSPSTSPSYAARQQPSSRLVTTPQSVTSKVAAAISNLEQRKKAEDAKQQAAGFADSATTAGRPSAFAHPDKLSPPSSKTVKFIEQGRAPILSTSAGATNEAQAPLLPPSIPEPTKLSHTAASTVAGPSKISSVIDSLSARLEAMPRKSPGTDAQFTATDPTRPNKLNLAPYTDNTRLNDNMSHQDPFHTAGAARPSIDPPVMMPPPGEPYSPVRGFRGEPLRAASPTRPWTPSRRAHGGSLSHNFHNGSVSGIEYGRVPPNAHYEPADINGSPRPGTPASQYGGSPRRPLPPAPLFTMGAGGRTSTFADDATVSIPLGDDERSEVTGLSGMTGMTGSSYGRQRQSNGYRYEAASSMGDEDVDDDVFRPHSEVSGGTQSQQTMYGNNFSQVTLNEAEYAHGNANEFDEEGGKDIGDVLNHQDTGADEHGEFIHSANEKVDHYGPAPDGRQERRGVRDPKMAKKAVQLINGELVLECKIPTILFSFLPRRDEVEFTHMRYTAVTCDPDDFVARGYKLRQNIGRTARETELFICVTMYNENEYDFTRTMHAVMKNISHFCSRSKSRTWGETGWQKIVVCVVSDGRSKIHPRTLDALAAMGVYQHGIAKNYVNQKAVQAHVYEYTTQVSLDSDLKFKGAEKGIVPCQMIFCLKERNQRKLNSHRWFFNAFGRSLNPNVCILLDVGTRPGNNSLYHLWKAFDTDSNVAGACGEIKAMKGKYGSNLLNPLVASQNFEYKMSNILDKPLESVFGYITVLPGALSAYRYHALQNDETGHGPLSQYFKGETLHGQHADVFTANMYLAEDRILCWELVAKRGERWVLKYVKGCTGETDVPDSVPEFISQRRRWLNGAFFAAVYSLVHFKQLWLTDHTFARKVLLHMEFVYQFVNLLFTYFSLANFYLTFYFVVGGLADPAADPFGHGIGNVIFIIFRYALTLTICTQFILSLGNRPQGAKRLYLTSMIIYSIIMAYTTFATFYIVVKQLKDSTDISIGNNVFTNLIVSTASTIGLYFLMSFLYLDPWHMFTSSGQYFMLLPSYICTLQVYAFCNTHDVTWGTKGDNVMKTDLGGAVGKGSTVELEMPSEQLDIDSGYDEALRNLRDRIEVPESPVSESQLQEDYYKSVRTYMVVTWMVANAILAMAVSEVYGSSGIGNNFYLRFILWSVAGLALFRAIGSTTFAVINLINMIVEGRVRLSLKLPEWAGGWGSKISDTVSSVSSKVRR